MCLMMSASPAMNAVRYPAIFDCLLSEYSMRTPFALPSHTAGDSTHGVEDSEKEFAACASLESS